MANSIVKLLRTYIKDCPDNIAEEVATKLGNAKTLEEITAIRDEYKIDFNEDACKQIFAALNMDTKDLTDKDLEVVTGGCDSSDCHP